ncbi:MAG: MBL fold metallo-hydrolase [Balneolaceae bacterium]
MELEKYYLKPNVVIEPLVDKWYAWSHLISPATFALNLTGRHLKIMNSYIKAPLLHKQAVKNPLMLGGPFMDYESDKTEEVQTLLEETIENRKELIEFSEAIKKLDTLLSEEAVGYSLEPLYEKIPSILKGYVELVYDLNNRPSFRFFESLLYKSPLYNCESQSIALWMNNNDDRPFSLSTPRLSNDDVLLLNIPFKSEKIDILGRLKRRSNAISQIKDGLELSEDSFKVFKSFIDTNVPEPYHPYRGEKIRMRYFGHACILLETASFSIMVDPLISYYGYQSDVARFSDLDLPENLDYVLITHNHQDHILFETLLPLRHKIKNLVIPKTGGGVLQDPSLDLMFKSIGFKNVIEIGEMQSIEFSDCEITGVPFIGEHSDLDIQAKTCHHIRIGDFTILFLADSCNIEPSLYRHIHKEIGDVDVIFLGMECEGAPLTWLYGPLMNINLPRDMDNSRRLSGSNYKQGMSLIDIFSPQELYIYAMGQEPWTKFISSKKYTNESLPIIESDKLIQECNSRGITTERLFGEKELFFDKELSLKR